MIYYDYPKDKIEIFEASDKNYFFKGNKFSYLCSHEEIKKVDMKVAFSGFVFVAVEAVKAYIEYFFSSYNVQRMIATARAENIPSWKVIE